MKDKIQSKIDSIIDRSDEFRRGYTLTEKEKKLHGLIMQVFAFSANSIVELENIADQEKEVIFRKLLELDKIYRDEERQLEKLED